jgi:acetyl esterase/lipase
MKKTAFLLFLSAFCFLQTSAQNPGCDGSRYKDDIFMAVKKTTLPFSTAISQSGIQVTLSMDVYEPQGDNLSARPVVVLAHGGSFILGDKSDMKNWCELLAKKGCVAASIQYRLYPIFVLGYPDSVDIFDAAVKAVGDMKAAVRYFREDAATNNKFRADAANIFVGGFSAGAVAALHAGFLDSNDVVPDFIQTLLDANGGLNGNSGSASNQTYSASIKAVVNMSGGIYRSDWIDAQGVPLVSIHGTADGTVPYYSGLAADIAYLEGSGLIHPKAEAAGLIQNLHPVPGGDHTDIYEQSQFKPHVDTFWVNASTMLESLVCAAASATEELKNLEANWSVFPNPVSNSQFTVRLPERVQRAALSIADFSGKIVFQTKNIQNQGIVRLNGLPAGVYTVQIADMDNPTRLFAGKKLVLQE